MKAPRFPYARENLSVREGERCIPLLSETITAGGIGSVTFGSIRAYTSVSNKEILQHAFGVTPRNKMQPRYLSGDGHQVCTADSYRAITKRNALWTWRSR